MRLFLLQKGICAQIRLPKHHLTASTVPCSAGIMIWSAPNCSGISKGLSPERFMTKTGGSGKLTADCLFYTNSLSKNGVFCKTAFQAVSAS